MTPDSEGNLFWRRPQGHSREPCFPSSLGFPAQSRGRAQWTVKGLGQRSCPEKQRAFAEDDVLRGSAPDEAWRSTGQEEDSFHMQTQESCSQNPGCDFTPLNDLQTPRRKSSSKEPGVCSDPTTHPDAANLVPHWKSRFTSSPRGILLDKDKRGIARQKDHKTLRELTYRELHRREEQNRMGPAESEEPGFITCRT